MKNNAFWNFANGGDLPHSFNTRAWDSAWRKGIVNFEKSLDFFHKNSNFDNYNRMLQSLSVCNTLKNLLDELPLFLGGCSLKVKQNREESCIKELEILIAKHKNFIINFLQNEVIKKKANTSFIKKEINYWNMPSVSNFDIDNFKNKIENEENMIELENFQFNQLPYLIDKFESNAKKMGIKGYVADALDPDLEYLTNVQESEESRKTLWLAIQQNSPTNKKINQMIDKRNKHSIKNGFDNYIDMLDFSMHGLSLNDVSRQAQKQLGKLSKSYNDLHLTMTSRGQKKDGSVDIANKDKPWNEAYLHWQVPSRNLYLTGGEFPLKRVLNVIVPDILSIGGWSVDGNPKKIGKNKQCLFEYRLTKYENDKKRQAIVYLAPYPASNFKSSDTYKAYASCLRERWSNQGENIPVALVAQNFELNGQGLDNLDELGYLAHELGHVLHFFAFSGKVYDEFKRMPLTLGELPSTLMENLAQDPKTLVKWSDSNCSYAKRVDYWKRRTRPSIWDVKYLVEKLERVWLDINAHNKNRQIIDLSNLRNYLREKTGLLNLEKEDRQANRWFDFTQFAGQMSCYDIGYALGFGILGDDLSGKNVRASMRYLLDNILSDSNTINIDTKWRKVYGESLKTMFKKGMDNLSESKINDLEDKLVKIK